MNNGQRRIILNVSPKLRGLLTKYVERLKEEGWEIEVIEDEMFRRPRLITPFWTYVGRNEIERFVGI